MAAYTTIDDPSAYFKVQLYTGDGSNDRGIVFDDTDTDMQPDFVWIKNRDATDGHCLFDAVRGATKLLPSDSTATETTDADTLTSFDSDGFALGADVKVNTNTEKYVAWCWKESADAGFDIVLFTGNVTARTISHSLSAVPHVMILRNRSEVGGDGAWIVYHQKNTSAPETDALQLALTNATEDYVGYFNDTAPTSSVFTVGDHLTVNGDGNNMLAYLWSEKQGFSKFGSYTGNGNADGTFVYTGFRPAFVMFKETDSTSPWSMFDNKRDVDNVTHHRLEAQATNAEYTGSEMYHDILSNGFKLRTTDAEFNTSGGTYIYMAFAEAPFVNSNGVPCNAR